MSTPADVVVVGGGVIGLTTAYFLARAGVAVCVIDRSELGREASWAGAGIVPPGNPGLARTAADQLRAHSSALFPQLSAELRERTGIDNGYCVCGGLVIPAPGEEAPEQEWAAEGARWQRVDAEGIRRLGPELRSGIDHGFYLPDMAQVRNPRHVRALQAACEGLGVRLRPHCGARSLVTGRGRAEAVETDQGRLNAGQFLVAAGAWTDGLLAPLGWQPGIRPVRGQIALLNPGHPRLRPVLLVGNRYLVPRLDGRILVGSTEEDAGFEACPTAGGIAGLLTFATGLVPGLAAAPLERTWAGLRPGSPDGLPFLGPVPGWDNVFVAAGHFRAGIQLSPGTGLVMSDLLLGRPPSLSLEPFRVDRTPSPPLRCAFRS
jgi:glycine oxidase